MLRDIRGSHSPCPPKLSTLGGWWLRGVKYANPWHLTRHKDRLMMSLHILSANCIQWKLFLKKANAGTTLPLQGTQVQSPVGEPKSHLLSGVAKKIKERLRLSGSHINPHSRSVVVG